MSLRQPVMSLQERVEAEAEATAARVMGQLNVLAWQLVEMMVEVLDAGAWAPAGGLRSPEHWLCWRTGMSASRRAGSPRSHGGSTSCRCVWSCFVRAS